LFFGEVPRATTVAGAAVIVVAGLIALRMAQSDAQPESQSEEQTQTDAARSAKENRHDASR
jgi:hypothetical protein